MATPPRKSPGSTVKTPSSQSSSPMDFAFGKENYMLMITGIIFLIVGFVLMSGGGSDDPNVFNPDIFSPRRITVAPIIVMIGFAIEFYAIIKKSKE
jgi:hypothetical protein